jgi:tetratricopeptide (TPR) repeat protein
MPKRDYFKIACSYLKGGAIAKAERNFNVCIRHSPNDWKPYFFLGHIWLQHKCGGLDSGGWPTAKYYYRKAIELKPDLPEAINNMAIAHRRRDEHDEAIAWFFKGLGQNVNANMLSNIGSCLMDMGDMERAERFLRRALVMAPKHNDANWNLALTLLAQRKWEEGWEQHDWGFRAKERGLRPYVEYWPGWHGQPLEGKTLLVWGEQGIGDEILFASCLNDLRALKPKEVIFDCHPRLERVFRRSFPWVRVYGKRKDKDMSFLWLRAALALGDLSKEETLNVIEAANRTNAPSDAVCPRKEDDPQGKDKGPWVRLQELPNDVQHSVLGKAAELNVFCRWGIDYHVPLGTLPKFFRRGDSDFPRWPVLRADQRKVVAYRSLSPDGLRVGIAWRGGSNKTAVHRRSIPLEKFAEAGILQLPGITWVSLQYGDVEMEIQKVRRQYGVEIYHDNAAIEGPAPGHLDEQLALTKSCNLVISVIQTTVHMAGALGVPTWCLTCAAPPWKFHGKLDERDTLLWHPSVRMFRQEGDTWPLDKIRENLQLLLPSAQEDTKNTAKTSLPVFGNSGRVKGYVSPST